MDLSSRVASVALVHNGTTLAQESWNQENVPRQHLFILLPGLFSCPDRQVTSIDHFVVGLGPGSFSGIRTAIAAAIGLALPGKRPVNGISGAESLAWDILREHQRSEVVIVGDARRQRLWAARYRCENGDIRSSMACTLLTREAFRQSCSNTDLLVSPEFERLEEFLRDVSRAGPEILPESRYPRAEAIAHIALRRLRDNKQLDPPQPVYLHPAVFVKPKGG